MDKVWNFLKPNLAKIEAAVAIWIILAAVSHFFIAKCLLADCARSGQMTSCCSLLENKIAEFVYIIKISYPAVAYLLACKLVK